MLSEKLKSIELGDIAHICKNNKLPKKGDLIFFWNICFEVIRINGNEEYTLKFLEFTHFETKTKRNELC